MTEVRRLFDWYVQHQAELVEKYNGRFIVIVGEAVVADFADEDEALQYATGHHPAGSFMIQKVSPGDEGYTQVFHSRVAI